MSHFCKKKLFFYSFTVAVKLIFTSTLKSIGPASERTFPDNVIVVELLFTKASSNWLKTFASVISKTVPAVASWEIFKFVMVPTTTPSNFSAPEITTPFAFPVKSLYL